LLSPFAGDTLGVCDDVVLVVDVEEGAVGSVGDGEAGVDDDGGEVGPGSDGLAAFAFGGLASRGGVSDDLYNALGQGAGAGEHGEIRPEGSTDTPAAAVGPGREDVTPEDTGPGRRRLRSSETVVDGSAEFRVHEVRQARRQGLCF